MPPRAKKGARSKRIKQSGAAASIATPGDAKYSFTACLKEDHGQPLFGVAFNPFLVQAEVPQYIFATVGSNRASIYECHEDGNMSLLQAYVDENPDEVYYSACWTHDKDKDVAILAVGGYLGIIRLISTKEYTNYQTLSGHGNAVNELKFHPHELTLLVSASKDNSIRLWNIETGICIAVFSGGRAHRDEVLSVDFSINGNKIISCGMDQSVKFWDIRTAEIEQRIALAKTVPESSSRKTPFPTLNVIAPFGSTCGVHRNYVDCVRWYGDLVLSKSTENEIALWMLGGEPRLDLPEERQNYLGDPVTVIRRLPLRNCSIWFVKFDLEPSMRFMVAGNQVGEVMLWDLSRVKETQTPIQVLSHTKSSKAVRQAAFSADSRYIVYVCDDGTIHRWDRIR